MYPRLALIFVLLVAALLPARAAGPETIVFAWSGPVSVGYAPFTFAEDLGLISQENITLSTVALDGSGVILPQLMKGSLFTTFSTLDPLIISRQPGKPDFDFRFVYNSARNSIWEISVLDKSPIKSLKDLAGKTIGVGALSFGGTPMTEAALKAVGTGATAFEALRSGKIDALNLFDITDAKLRIDGTPVRVLPYPPEFDGVSSHAFPMTNKMIRERPDLVGKFGRIAAEGTVACNANPPECLRSLWRHYPELKPPGSDADGMKEMLPILLIRLQHMTQWQSGEPKKWGIFSDKDWTAEITALKAGGLITVDPKLDTLYTNQFVDDFNRFDTGAVVRRAKAYTSPH
jgi:NitT/TauT family transport system substrate-binding protein